MGYTSTLNRKLPYMPGGASITKIYRHDHPRRIFNLWKMGPQMKHSGLVPGTPRAHAHSKYIAYGDDQHDDEPSFGLYSSATTCTTTRCIRRAWRWKTGANKERRKRRKREDQTKQEEKGRRMRKNRRRRKKDGGKGNQTEE